MPGNGPRSINRLLSCKQAANFLTDLGLAISAQTLARLFCEKKGPLCMRVGSRAMYREADLIAYLRSARQARCAEKGGGGAFVDLDGPLWLANDREGGVRGVRGVLEPPAPGFWGTS